MRKRKLLILSGILLLAAMVAGCRQDQRIKSRTLEKTFSETEPFPISVKISLDCPSGGASDAALSNMKDLILTAALGAEYVGMDAETAVNNYITQFVEAARKDVPEVPAEEGIGVEEVLTGCFDSSYKDIVTYVVTDYMFEGGAHGMTGISALNFNMKTGEAVSENDLFAPGYPETLSACLTAHLREALGDEDAYAALFVKDIAPNSNFKVSEDGITYVYNAYEIGPYYLGAIEVTVPWAELESILKP